MPSMQVHGFETAWVSSDPAHFLSVPASFTVAGGSSLGLNATDGAAGATAIYTPSAPLDLRGYDELRFWCYADQVADGSERRPFLLELGYADAGDAPGEQHRWLVPVSRARAWEPHSIGIAGERRAQIAQWSLRSLTDRPARFFLDDLRAVAENPLSDVESALVEVLGGRIPLPGVTAIAVLPAAAGATTLRTALNRRLRAGNRILVDSGGPGAPDRYAVTGASHNDGAATTTLTITPALVTSARPGTTISVTVPVVVEEAPFASPTNPADLPDPVILVALTDQREEPERSWRISQRDSFRTRGALTVCSTRPAARPIILEYQILAASEDRTQSLNIRAALTRCLGLHAGLRVNGTLLPVHTLLPPPLAERDRAILAPLYIHVEAQLEPGTRLEVPLPRREREGEPAISPPIRVPL
jgi:hypothetical protein